jgi:hypothetical protein
MGLIREPKNVNFTVLNKTWTVDEQNEVSEFIKARKEILKKKVSASTDSKQKKTISRERRKTSV